jgi:hypothetical protein
MKKQFSWKALLSLVVIGFMALLVACGLPPAPTIEARPLGSASWASLVASTWWQPTQGLAWQWQLSGIVDFTVPAQVYDIDAEGATTAQVTSLKNRGVKTIGYIDTSYEPGRIDSAILAPYRCGAYQGWPGQYWLDFRQSVVRQAMAARIQMVASKGFDGLEADSVDAITNNPGCSPALTPADQLGFIRFLADTAHASGLAFGLKNNPDQAIDLVSSFDFMVIEECVKYSECDVYKAASSGKAMFSAEYVSGITNARFLTNAKTRAAKICTKANALGLSTIIKVLDLDAKRYSCN